MTTRQAELKIAAVTGTLRCCQLFSGLPARDLEEIAGFAVLQNLERGESLFRQGEPIAGFYVVQRGAINVHRVGPGGKEQVIHVFRMGESFAEAALAGPSGYPADARTVEPSTVLLIPRGPILALIRRQPDLALRMLGSMSQHLRVLVAQLDDLTLKDVETRLANWLVRRAKGRAGAVRDTRHEADAGRRAWHHERNAVAHAGRLPGTGTHPRVRSHHHRERSGGLGSGAPPQSGRGMTPAAAPAQRTGIGGSATIMLNLEQRWGELDLPQACSSLSSAGRKAHLVHRSYPGNG